MQMIKLNEDQHVATVSLNRPEVHNAFHPEMIQELTEIFQNIKQDPSLRAVILRGEGRSFCAGADLNWMKEMIRFNYEDNRKDAEKMFHMFSTIRDCALPVIGVAHGRVMGGGLGLLSVCDWVLAETQTRFCFSEVKLGLAPATIAPFVLEKTNMSFCRYYMLSAQEFGAEEASRAGLVQFVGSSNEITDQLQVQLKIIKSSGLDAIKGTKKLLNQSSPLESLKDQAVSLISSLRISSEAQSRIKIFLEKK